MAQLSPLSKGTFNVAGHGDGKTLQGMRPLDVYKDIKNHPKYKEGMTIHLYSCLLGEGGDNSFAQQLADIMQVTVIASDKFAMFSPLSPAISVHPQGTINGWITFEPRSK